MAVLVTATCDLPENRRPIDSPRYCARQRYLLRLFIGRFDPLAQLSGTTAICAKRAAGVDVKRTLLSTSVPIGKVPREAGIDSISGEE
jgi:hypothetical protein